VGSEYSLHPGLDPFTRNQVTNGYFLFLIAITLWKCFIQLQWLYDH